MLLLWLIPHDKVRITILRIFPRHLNENKAISSTLNWKNYSLHPKTSSNRFPRILKKRNTKSPKPYFWLPMAYIWIFWFRSHRLRIAIRHTAAQISFFGWRKRAKSRKTPKLSVGSIIILRTVVANEFGNNLSGPCIHLLV